MYSYILRRSLHRQTAIVHDVSNRKKNSVIDGPPPFCIQMCSSSLKPIQIPAMLRHGGTLKVWHDIGCFWYHGGTLRYSQITGPRASEKIDDNHEHFRNSDEFIISSSLVPILPMRSSSHNTPTPRKCDRATSTHRNVCFLSNIVPPGNGTGFQQFGRDNGL